MKGIVIHEYGPPDVLRGEDLPDPAPGPGDIMPVTCVHLAPPQSCFRLL